MADGGGGEKSYFVYCMRAETGHFKFGVSDNVKNRLGAVQTGCPMKVSIYSVWQADNKLDAYRVEGSIHSYLYPFKTSGEWFLECEETTRLADQLSKMDVHTLLSLCEERWVARTDDDLRSLVEKIDRLEGENNRLRGVVRHLISTYDSSRQVASILISAVKRCEKVATMEDMAEIDIGVMAEVMFGNLPKMPRSKRAAIRRR